MKLKNNYIIIDSPNNLFGSGNENKIYFLDYGGSYLSQADQLLLDSTTWCKIMHQVESEITIPCRSRDTRWDSWLNEPIWSLVTLTPEILLKFQLQEKPKYKIHQMLGISEPLLNDELKNMGATYSAQKNSIQVSTGDYIWPDVEYNIQNFAGLSSSRRWTWGFRLEWNAGEVFISCEEIKTKKRGDLYGSFAVLDLLNKDLSLVEKETELRNKAIMELFS